jgi:hypothetical protein
VHLAAGQRRPWGLSRLEPARGNRVGYSLVELVDAVGHSRLAASGIAHPLARFARIRVDVLKPAPEGRLSSSSGLKLPLRAVTLVSEFPG